MRIRINGKDEAVDSGSTLQDIVTRRGLRTERLVIDHNSNLVPPEKWTSIIIKENDVIELISFVGGG